MENVFFINRACPVHEISGEMVQELLLSVMTDYLTKNSEKRLFQSVRIILAQSLINY